MKKDKVKKIEKKYELKPIVSSIEKERISLLILNTYVSRNDVLIKFYSDGYINEYKGSIKKIDVINNCLSFKNKITISLEDIVEINEI